MVGIRMNDVIVKERKAEKVENLIYEVRVQVMLIQI